MFVDWAGATIPVYDRHTGEVWQASLFVAALGASSYTWAEATRDQQMESWLRSHVHAFEHFHGIPALAVPDNTKTGVTKAHRYDPDLNPTYTTSRSIAARHRARAAVQAEGQRLELILHLVKYKAQTLPVGPDIPGCRPTSQAGL